VKRSVPLKRSGFGRQAPPRERAPVMLVPVRGGPRSVYAPAGAVVVAMPKGPPARPGKRAPTVEEAMWMTAIVDFGCIACRIDSVPPRPAAVHHILRGGRRMGHLYTLPLCPGHHQDGTGAAGLIARHPWKTRFEAAYGTESELLIKVQRAVNGVAAK
jgi:hypothetical protein